MVAWLHVLGQNITAGDGVRVFLASWQTRSRETGLREMGRSQEDLQPQGKVVTYLLQLGTTLSYLLPPLNNVIIL